MLWGLALALIPLLIHLFDKRRSRPHPFGAISFVLRSQRRTARRFKLKRLLIFASRTLLLLAIPLALARPEWAPEGQAPEVASGPAATTLILDTSLSMRFQKDGPLFERGKKLALDALRSLRPEEPSNLLLCGEGAAKPEPPGFERNRQREILEEARPTYGTSDMTRCLELAARSLDENPMPGKRLIVVSDFTSSAFRLDVPPPQSLGPNGEAVRPEVVLKDAGLESLPNYALHDLRIAPAAHSAPRTLQFTFTVKNYSAAPHKDLEASLKVGQQVVSKAFLEVAPSGTAQKTLTHTFEEGGRFFGEISLTSDALAEDDKLSFAVDVPKEVSALVINGAPSATRHRDEAFFVEAALGASGSLVKASYRDVAAGFREDFSLFDVVLLLNVHAPDASQAAKLDDFVERGGGLFLSMGDQVDPDAYNKSLEALLPRKLRLVKAAESGPRTPNARPERLSQVNFEHPLFSPFVGKAREGLWGARFFKYMLLEAGGKKDTASSVLATFEDGSPALAVTQKGKGKVLLFSSTIDRDWSDFSIRTSFLPLMQRFCLYLAEATEEREMPRPRVGETPTFTDARLAKVKAPSGADVPVRSSPEGVSVGPLVEPGVHRALDGDNKPLDDLSFAVRLDASESDLTRIPKAQLSSYFGEAAVKAATASTEQPKMPLWTWLIALGAVAFFCEGLLLRK
jgi:hypothetical protein